MGKIVETIKDKPVAITIGTIAVVCAFIITMTASFTTRLNSIDSNLRHLNGKTDLYNERWEAVLAKQAQTDLAIVSIQKDILFLQEKLK